MIESVLLLVLTVIPNSATAQRDRDPNMLSLDGAWEIIFDHENQGKSGLWYMDAVFENHPSKQEIIVPSCWEELVQDYEGVAFYRRKFTVPGNWEGKIARLTFDAVNYLSEVWINDQVLGFHEGGFTPFTFRVDRLIRPGKENTLTMRVVGPILLTDKNIDGMGRMEVPQWRGAITGGIWQPVTLRASGRALVKDLFIEPKIGDNTAVVNWEVENTAAGNLSSLLEIKILDAEDEVTVEKREKITLLPGSNQNRWTFKIPNASYWTMDNPYLYTLEVILKTDGAVSDRWETRFGMREFTIRNDQFYLNGEPIYLKACFFEGLYPVKLAYPDSREMVIREIQLAKDAGFNMIRPWRKPPPPMWLDLCNEMGMMTVGSLVVECMERPLSTPYLPYRVENELRQSILRDRNRTCIVMWELFNELYRPILIQMLRPMSLLARELDPTRLILDESGGWAEGAKMYLPYERTGFQFNDIHDYAGSQITEDIYNGYLMIGTTRAEREELDMGHIKIPGRNVIPGRMSFVSELGYGSLPNLVENNKQFEKQGNPMVPATRYHKRLAQEITAALKTTGFDEVYPDLEQFCIDQQRMHGIANKRILEASRCNPNVKGYCVHALAAGDWVLGAGLIDLWRNPKTRAYDMTKEANRSRIVSIRVLPRNVYAENGAQLQITGVNDLEKTEARVLVEIVSENGETVLRKAFTADLPAGISKLFRTPLDTKTMMGSYEVKVSLKDENGNPITSNNSTFDVFQPEQLAAPKTKISVIDPAGSIIPFLNTSGLEYTIFDPDQDPSIPVIIGTAAEKDEAYLTQVLASNVFVRNGGFAVFLDVPGEKLPWFDRKLHDTGIEVLPFKAQLLNSLGLWAGRPHMVKEHPVFEGLPVNTIMSGVYENIHPAESMIRQEGEYICGVVTYDHFPDIDKMKRHYAGPGDVWWAADVLLAPLGKGEMLLSTLKLTENLGKDPVADKVFFNMIRFAVKNELE
jgi:hypothetical protein